MSFDSYKRVTDGPDVDVSFDAGSYIYIYIYVNAMNLCRQDFNCFPKFNAGKTIICLLNHLSRKLIR
jgi:hypothetical protein